VTAEIAVMNRHGVALAADSAATVGGDEIGRKAWQSANKIFGMSHRHPVGIMVYGGADLMGVPWEVVIKLYRDRLGSRSFPSLSDYTDDFLVFLQTARLLFPSDLQESWFQAVVTGTFEAIKEMIEEVVRTRYGEQEVGLENVRDIVGEVIDERLESLEQAPTLEHVTDEDVADLARRYAESIRAARSEVFQDLPLTRKSQTTLRRIATLLFARQAFSELSSGIVIAGYGDQEHFPRFDHLIIESIVNDKVNYHRSRQAVITMKNGAHVQAFAQSEMVMAFMEGVNADYERVVEELINEVTREYPNILVDNIPRMSKKRRDDLKAILAEVSDEVARRLLETLERVREDYYAQPIIDVVTVLPKDELAAMAEALVNLTAVRRKLSFSIETVGGPIDVAVISKGDGFVWLKRKNYFDLTANPHFVAKYLRPREVPDHA
jgi:DNA-directed RNA polymerase subunit F